MFRLLHTADLHIGRLFSGWPSDTAARLRAARLSAIDHLADQARAHGARHVLVAGDLFDSAAPAAEDRRQAAEAMGECLDLRWWILPGNHDPAASPVWDAWRKEAPSNAVLLDEPRPVEAEPGLWILPAPVGGAALHGDPSAVWDAMVTPLGAVRVGLAHGSAATFGSTPNPNALDPARAARLGLAYAALGDWHGQKIVAPGVAYAGTPEADGFGAKGRAWVVEVGDGAPRTTSIAVGSLHWARSASSLPPDMDPVDAAALVQAARPEGRARATLWRWEPQGRATPSVRAALEAAFAQAAASYLHASPVWEGVIAAYDPADAARMAPEGVLRTAVSDLMEQAAAPDPVAARALSLLASALERTAS